MLRRSLMSLLVAWGLMIGNAHAVARLYLSTGDDLYYTDSSGSAPTLVGSFGLTNDTIRELAWDIVHQRLWGLNYYGDTLYKINFTTGAATAVGSTGFSFIISPIPLAAYRGTLYCSGNDFNGHVGLWTLSISTGAASFVGPTGGGTFFQGLAISSSTGICYATQTVGSDYLATVSLTDGTETTVGATSHALSALSFGFGVPYQLWGYDTTTSGTTKFYTQPLSAPLGDTFKFSLNVTYYGMAWVLES